jgi:hypothetical protein
MFSRCARRKGLAPAAVAVGVAAALTWGCKDAGPHWTEGGDGRPLMGGAATVYRGDCPQDPDLAELETAWSASLHDFEETWGRSAPLPEVRIYMQRLDPGMNGARQGDTIALRCGLEYVLRHELNHLQGDALPVPCDHRKISRTHFGDGSEFDRAHPLKLDCSPW